MFVGGWNVHAGGREGLYGVKERGNFLCPCITDPLGMREEEELYASLIFWTCVQKKNCMQCWRSGAVWTMATRGTEARRMHGRNGVTEQNDKES